MNVKMRWRPFIALWYISLSRFTASAILESENPTVVSAAADYSILDCLTRCHTISNFIKRDSEIVAKRVFGYKSRNFERFEHDFYLRMR